MSNLSVLYKHIPLCLQLVYVDCQLTSVSSSLTQNEIIFYCEIMLNVLTLHQSRKYYHLNLCIKK